MHTHVGAAGCQQQPCSVTCAYSRPAVSMCGACCLAASSAASFTMLDSSAPEKPAVEGGSIGARGIEGLSIRLGDGSVPLEPAHSVRIDWALNSIEAFQIDWALITRGASHEKVGIGFERLEVGAQDRLPEVA